MTTIGVRGTLVILLIYVLLGMPEIIQCFGNDGGVVACVAMGAVVGGFKAGLFIIVAVLSGFAHLMSAQPQKPEQHGRQSPGIELAMRAPPPLRQPENLFAREGATGSRTDVAYVLAVSVGPRGVEAIASVASAPRPPPA